MSGGKKPRGCLLSFLLYSLRFVLILIALLVAFALFISLYGVPGAWTSRFTTWCGTQGVHLEIARVRWDLLDGIMLEQVVLFEKPSSEIPLFSARRVTLEFSPVDWWYDRPFIRSVTLSAGELVVQTTETPQAPANPESIVINAINGRAVVHPDRLVVEEVYGNIAGLVVSGTGVIHTPPLPAGTTFGQAMMDLYGLEPAEERPLWMQLIAEEINALYLPQMPRASLSFVIHPLDRTMNRIDLSATGGKVQCRGATLDSWQLKGAFLASRLNLTDLYVVQGERHFQCRGELDVMEQTVEMKTESNLPFDTLLSMMPTSWQARVHSVVRHPAGLLEFDVFVGPAPLANLLRKAGGSCYFRQADIADVWVDEADISVLIEDGVCAIRRLDLVVGSNDFRGPVSMSGTYNFNTRVLYGDAESDMDPRAFIAVLPPGALKEVNALQFTNGHPHGRYHFYGSLDEPDAFTVKGMASGTNFIYWGTDITSCQIGFSMSNETLILDPLTVSRGTNEYGEGSVAIYFDRDIVDVKASSSINPKALAPIISHVVDEFLEMFSFDGNTHIEMDGQIDYGDMTNMDFAASVSAEGMGLEWFHSDTCAFRFLGKGNELAIEDITGTMYGGAFQGGITFWYWPTNEHMFYAVTGSCKRVDFKEVALAVSDVEDATPYEGQLTANVALQGFCGEGQGHTATGTGSVLVARGKLFSIPLLGPVSRFLSKVRPGFGFASQTDFTADFSIADARVHSENAKLRGNIISLTARGDYYFDETLDITMRANFMRGGPIAKLVNFVTYPLTKVFFEFHLGGHLDDPNWRPQNLPKELYLQFD